MAAHNRLVGSSSPLSPTTQSRANRDFPVPYEKPGIGGHSRDVVARRVMLLDQAGEQTIFAVLVQHARRLRLKRFLGGCAHGGGAAWQGAPGRARQRAVWLGEARHGRERGRLRSAFFISNAAANRAPSPAGGKVVSSRFSEHFCSDSPERGDIRRKAHRFMVPRPTPVCGLRTSPSPDAPRPESPSGASPRSPSRSMSAFHPIADI
jgi:hypothetical protein